jgi:hypothetical protein
MNKRHKIHLNVCLMLENNGEILLSFFPHYIFAAEYSAVYKKNARTNTEQGILFGI